MATLLTILAILGLITFLIGFARHAGQKESENKGLKNANKAYKKILKAQTYAPRHRRSLLDWLRRGKF